jgi:hypothetical protein
MCAWICAEGEQTIARLNVIEKYPMDRTNIEVVPLIELHMQPGGRIVCLLLKRACDVQPKASSAMWISVTGATHDYMFMLSEACLKAYYSFTQSAL